MNTRRPGGRPPARAGSALVGGLVAACLAATGGAPAAAAGPGATAVPEPLVAYTFDDVAPGATTTANSGTGGSRFDGVVVNGAALTAGDRDGAATLSLPGGPQGSADTSMPFVRIPNGALQDATGISVSTWVRWDGRNVTGNASPWTWILGGDKLPGNNYGVFFSPDEGGRVTAAANDGREHKLNTSGALPADRWMHVGVVEDGSTLSLYVNGVLTDSRPAPIDLTKLHTADGTFSGLIGRTQWSTPYASFFGGQLDDFRVFATALTAEQVTEEAGGAATLTGPADDSIELTTNAGVAPSLPATVAGTWSDDYDRPVPVTWEPVEAADYAEPGTFTVAGTAAGRPVTATVQVRLENQVDIDLSDTTGDFLGGASGTLYGLYGEGLPSKNLIEAIRLRTVSTKAQDGPQHPGADALEVLKPIVDSSGGDVYIYMTDIYRGFPYQWPGDTPQARLDDFKAKIRVQVEQVKALPEPYRSHVVFVPFNEPEGNMFGTGQWSYDGTSWLDDPTEYFRAWDEVHAIIKGELPDARIAGPNTSILYDQVQGFMRHALANGTMPEVITWHELSDPAAIRRNVDRFRAWEDTIYAGTSHEGRHLPININEYAFNYHTSVPGQMIQWFSALEDKKVDGDIAYWNIDGNLSDSAVEANKGNGQWWLLQAYAQMTGETVRFDPPKPDVSYTLQGIATLDTAKKRSETLLGGAAGAADVRYSGIDPEVFGTSVHVAVKEIGWSGQIGDNSGPADVAEAVVPVTDGGISLRFGQGGLPVLKEESAYQVVLTPGANATAAAVAPDLWAATYEAEDAAHTGTGYSRNGPEGSPSNVGGFYSSGGYDVGGLRTGSDVKLDFTVDVPQDGRYDLSVFANSFNKYEAVQEQGPTNVFVTVDGAAEQELYLPLAYKWVVWDHADTTVELTAGRHTISLSARNLAGTEGTRGDAIVDKIDLSLPNPEAATRTYEAEDATLTGGATTDYSRAGVSGSGTVAVGPGAVTSWVYSPEDAEHRLHLDATGSGSATLQVNGNDLGTFSGAVTRDVFLAGGINKVVVTGATGEVVLDRVRVAPSAGQLEQRTVQAEAGTRTGQAAVTAFPLADGGQAVTGVGGDPGNDSSLTVAADAPRAGRYAVTVRYSNGEQSPASHYNPDPLGRHADISVNGAAAQRVWFPHTFHDDNFWTLTFYADLQAGSNRLTFRSEELPDWNGETYISDRYPELGLRSPWAPNLDRLTITPLLAAAGPAPDVTAPTVTVKQGSRYTVGSKGSYSTVSFKLYDAGKVAGLTLNGVAKDLTDAVWSDLNGVRPGRFGGVEGVNTLVVTDVAGNATTTTFRLDTTRPTVTVKSGSSFTVGRNPYKLVSFKLFDAGKVDSLTLNGVRKDLTDAVWSDLNHVAVGSYGGVKGRNTLVVRDLAGNTTTVTFRLTR